MSPVPDNQNGSYVGPAYTPGEYITVGAPDSHSVPTPLISGDWRDLFVTTMYDTVVEKYLRPRLIFDQFAVPRDSRTTHKGGTRRIFFRDDLSEATSPLAENRDVDSDSLTGRYMDVVQDEYGKAVTRTELLEGVSMVPYDPGGH